VSASFPVTNVGQGSGIEAAPVERMRRDHDQLRDAAIRHGPQQDLFDDREHRSIDANAQPQRNDRRNGERGGLSELSQGVAKVLGQRSHAQLSEFGSAIVAPVPTAAGSRARG
jgi:hypothetical protein